jgi:hypothetical protein
MDFIQMKTYLFLIFVGLPVFTLKAGVPTYPEEVTSYLKNELPQMDVAVKNKDMSYFENANKRMENFLVKWGLGNPLNTTLDDYPSCTNAMTDYQIVGLCKILPSGSICEPETFFPKFEKNLENCMHIANKS